MKNALSNTGRVDRAYDNWLQTNPADERAAEKESAIEDKAIEIYREILDSPSFIEEAIQESDNAQLWSQFATNLGEAIRNEIPAYDIQYLTHIKSALNDLLMDYATKQAESWHEEL